MPLRDPQTGQFVPLADSIRRRFDDRAAPVPAALRERVHRRLDSLAADLVLARIPSDYFQVLANPGLQAFVLFRGTSDSIVVDASLPQPVRRALCWAVLEAADVASDYALPARLRLASFLTERVQRWDNFHERGYSMLPLELFINSWIGERWAPFRRPPLEPPARALIVLHPSASLEIPLRDLSWSVNGRDALMLEPLGFVDYNADRTRYWGLSVAGAFSAGQAPAWGGVLHLGRLQHVGYLYRSSSPDGRQHVLTISADLLKSVAGRAQEWRADYDAIRRRLAECPRDVRDCVQGSDR